MNYSTAYAKVASALHDEGEGEIYNLALAYTQEDNFSKIKHSIADDYQKFHNLNFGVPHGAVQMTVETFLFAMLVGSPNMKYADAYENESQAIQDGFFWIDSIERYLKLSF